MANEIVGQHIWEVSLLNGKKIVVSSGETADAVIVLNLVGRDPSRAMDSPITNVAYIGRVEAAKESA